MIGVSWAGMGRGHGKNTQKMAQSGRSICILLSSARKGRVFLIAVLVTVIAVAISLVNRKVVTFGSSLGSIH